jgi:hypothetical protein
MKKNNKSLVSTKKQNIDEVSNEYKKEIYKKALYIVKNFDKKKKYNCITLHTTSDEYMNDILNMLSKKFRIDISDVKYEYPKTQRNFDDLYYYDTLNYEFAETSNYAYLKICYDNNEVLEMIINYTKNKVINKSIWYPSKPDILSAYKGKCYKSKMNKKTKPKYPIYIISKGRANINGTAKYLEEIGLDYKLVVEPKEYDEYKKYHPNNKILVCPENFSELGKGSIPVRNYVWEMSKEAGDERHWILDDNIYNYKRIHKGQKIIIKSPLIFKVVEDFVDRFTNVKMAGHQYSFFAVGNVNPVILNTRIFSSILLSNDIYPEYAWRGRYNEDIDLSIRLLKNMKYTTVLFNTITANKAETMTCKGGNTNTIYAEDDAHLKKAEQLQEAHPDVVKIVEKYGRIHHQANLNRFKNNEFIWKTGKKEKNEKMKNKEYDLVLEDL